MKIDFTATASYAQDEISADKLRGALQLSKARVHKKVVKQLVEKDKFVKNQATFDFSPLEADSRRMNLGIGDGGDHLSCKVVEHWKSWMLYESYSSY